MRWRVLVSVALVLLAGCATSPQPAGGPEDSELDPEPLDRRRGPEATALRFDGAGAYEHVLRQIAQEDGSPQYRVPGTSGNAAVADYIADTMSALGFTTTWHFFNATYGCVTTPMHNIIAERPGSSDREVLFVAHYDTRPVADKDPDPEARDEPVLGANDGASGVAVLLELARVLPPTNDTVRFVFFDGEDGGGYKGRTCTDWILGSRAYAETLSGEAMQRIRAVVLVDMIGDPDLRLPLEGYSRTGSGQALQGEIYATAQRLSYPQFVPEPGPSILDDHVPFLERDIPAVDLIHLVDGSGGVFPWWHHTRSDTLDVVSAESLEAVGRTLEAWLREAS